MKKLLESLTKMSDIRLVKHVQHGNNRAFAALVARHSPGLRSIVRNILHKIDNEQDAVQEVWIAALPKLRKHNYKETGHLTAWLHTLAHRIAKRMKNEEDRYVLDEQAVENKLEDEALRSAEKKESQPALLSLLNILNRKLRLIVILHAIKGVKFRDVAVKMHIDEDVARALYGRAIGYLRIAEIKMKKKNNFD